MSNNFLKEQSKFITNAIIDSQIEAIKNSNKPEEEKALAIARCEKARAQSFLDIENSKRE
tara:strand:- start:1005 stop:1184 length:180 start_codon:yes stop_codon:yes gene_type:complete